MTRLPIPGSDSGNWGTILNDFLDVAHNNDGTLKQAGLITGAQQTSQKGQANGYASLDNSGKVPASQLPAASGVGDYMGVSASGFSVVSGDFPTIAWDGTTVTNGSSLAFDSGDPELVQVDEVGVYSITVTVDWNDQNQAGIRTIQIFTECQFLVNDQRPSTNDATSPTIQSVSTTLYLQPSDNIFISINQISGSSLSVFARMIVTRCA